MALPTLTAALIGILGAAVAYYLPWHRGESLQKSGRSLIFDIVCFFGIAAGLTAILYPETEFQALFIGAGWPSLLGALVSRSNELYAKQVKQDVKYE